MDRRGKKERGFFKTFISSRSGEKLKIPSAYTRYMRGNLPAKVFLRDRYGNSWTVGIEETENERFFVGGWSKFVEENSLEDGDFLVFKYDYLETFEVKLLGRNCCEKRGVGGPKCQSVGNDECLHSEEDEDESQSIRENQHLQIEEDKDDDNKVEDEDEDEAEDDEEEAADDDDEEEDNEDEDENEAGDDDFDDDDDDHVEDEEEETKDEVPNCKSGLGESSSLKDKGAHKRLNKYTSYADEIFKSGRISPPKNPYFVTKIRRMRRDELYVPRNVIKDYNLDLPSTIILRDSDGREWPSTLTPWVDGRTWYYGGWASLCRVNHVQETDACICEFVKGEGKKKYDIIKVRVVKK